MAAEHQTVAAEKAYSGDDVRNDASARRRVDVQLKAAHDKCRSAGGHQSIGACARHALPPLTLQANCCTHKYGCQ